MPAVVVKVFLIAALCLLTQVAVAQEQSSTSPGISSTYERLEFVQRALSQKLVDRRLLGEQIEAANEQDKSDLRKQADDITEDIRQLRNSLESIAIGGIDISLFESDETVDEGNWREDVALIAQPIIDSLKDLTEKPRKIKELNDTIALHQQELVVARGALNNLQPELARDIKSDLHTSLDNMARKWSGRRDDAETAIELARFQIADLQGDKPLIQTIWVALKNFLQGRGLTLLIAGVAALSVWLGVRFLLSGYRRTLKNETPEKRTRYRLAAYSVHALTFTLILVAVFIVFYERGDVLLLGLLILLMIGLALGIRQLLPQYVSEARLLLNIGAMRENERVLFRGLPWRVESINMYTVLRNPELHGVLRIPLGDLHEVTSRPAGKDSWFPSSRGDIVLFDDEALYEVIDQNPDTVELKQRGGQQISVPTTEFYTREMTNLSRGSTFGVVSVFGIDYQHQSISLVQIPKALRDAIRHSLLQTNLEPFLKDVRVELKEAGASSIDYWLYVTMDSKAARSYLRIKRNIQTACIDVCTRENWDIPFPHMMLVNKNQADSDAG